MTTYTITAGNNTTDLGTIGTAATIDAARKIGRAAVRDMLPSGEGTYNITDNDGQRIGRGERSIRTDRNWIEE